MVIFTVKIPDNIFDELLEAINHVSGRAIDSPASGAFAKIWLRNNFRDVLRRYRQFKVQRDMADTDIDVT